MEAEQTAMIEEPSQDASSTTPANCGAAMMREAADEVLREDCKAIARALAKSSMKGHIQSSKFLYDLADEKRKIATVETERPFHSLVEEFANEPEWTGDRTGYRAGERAREASENADQEI